MQYDPVNEDPLSINPNHPSSMKPVILKSSGEDLLGTFYQAGGEGEKPLVILLHGFPGNEQNHDIAHAIKRYGWNALIFHYRGAWGSRGVFSWSNAISDTFTVIDSVKSGFFNHEMKVDSDKVVLVGHSMGGFFATHALTKNYVDNVFAMALFNLGMIGELISGNPAYEALALESISSGAKLFRSDTPEELLKEMIHNSTQWNLLSSAPVLAQKNFYMLGAAYDQTAHLDMHYKPIVNILNKINPGKNYGEILEAGHSFSDMRITVTRKVISWLDSIKF